MDGLDSSDESLMLAYGAGQQGAFEQLYARHRTRLYRYLLRRLHDNGLADEVFQDVWQRVIAGRAGWTPDFERRRELQLALDALPDDQREVVLLRLEQELSLEEIASVTGVGRETVKSRLRYAMDKLRARLPA